MHDTFNFHFLNTISKQLTDALDALDVTALNGEALAILERFQSESNSKQGVYLLHYEDRPVYLGKSDDVAVRLSQHLKKLSGRLNISMSQIGYKCILLDKSMSTAANEDVLIKLFKEIHAGMWNGTGFGPNDPGVERDTTKPGGFDSSFPINLELNIDGINDRETLKSLCRKIKDQLPYVFRHGSLGIRANDEINLARIERTPQPLLKAIIERLGPGWIGAIVGHGLVFYQNKREYRWGEVIRPLQRIRGKARARKVSAAKRGTR